VAMTFTPALHTMLRTAWPKAEVAPRRPVCGPERPPGCGTGTSRPWRRTPGSRSGRPTKGPTRWPPLGRYGGRTGDGGSSGAAFAVPPSTPFGCARGRGVARVGRIDRRTRKVSSLLDDFLYACHPQLVNSHLADLAAIKC
jgi:hypothetical protein